MGHQVATIALGPVLFLQGRAVRRRTPKLPEPSGPRAGTTGRGTSLRLLIVGDSAAAGVGVARQDDALLGHLVSRLAERHRVSWRLLARTGATTRSTLGALDELGTDGADVVVTSLGVNDVTAGLGRAEWRSTQRSLRDALRHRVGVRHLVVCGLPPVHRFPALPQPLRWYLGRRARQFDRDLLRDVSTESDVSFLSMSFAEGEGDAAADGFHPGPRSYAAWGAQAAEAVLDAWARARGPGPAC